MSKWSQGHMTAIAVWIAGVEIGCFSNLISISLGKNWGTLSNSIDSITWKSLVDSIIPYKTVG